MQTVLITGGTGMIGQALAKQLLANGYEVIILSRNPKRSSRLHLSYAKWDIEKGEIDIDALAKANIIVHLAGEGVADKIQVKKRGFRNCRNPPTNQEERWEFRDI